MKLGDDKAIIMENRQNLARWERLKAEHYLQNRTLTIKEKKTITHAIKKYKADEAFYERKLNDLDNEKIKAINQKLKQNEQAVYKATHYLARVKERSQIKHHQYTRNQ